MRSSTSSSEHARHALMLALALSTALLSVVGAEAYWRRAGYRAGIVDSPQLWSIERDRVNRAGKTPLVILGSSRIQFSIDPPTLARALPSHQPIMLAINGRYPMAALRDLADDPSFRGLVFCDVDALALSTQFREMQAAYVDYWRHHWTPAWHAHRVLLNPWQRHALIARPEHGAVAAIKRWWAGQPAPYRPYHVFRRDRSGDIHFEWTDVPALIRHFEVESQNVLAGIDKPSPAEWRRDLKDVHDWVRRIQARGGQVVFFEPPMRGSIRALVEQHFPKRDFWDVFAAETPGIAIHFDELPAMATVNLPDQLHLDWRDKGAYTLAIADALKARAQTEPAPAP